MREIKFIGKSIKSNEWIESMTISKGLIKRKMGKVFFEINENEWCGIKPETVSQFVGIKDKNNIELFENNLVKFEDKIYKVIFQDGAFCLLNEFYQEIISMYDYRNNEFEKVGNIFDNSELYRD